MERNLILTVRIDRATLAALDIYAINRGGRSSAVRGLIRAGLALEVEPPPRTLGDGPVKKRISLRLTDTETTLLAHRAAQQGMTRSGWIKALVRRQVGLRVRLPTPVLDQLGQIRAQLFKLRRDLDMAVRAISTAVSAEDARNIETSLKEFAEARIELAEHISTLAITMKGEADR